jgi:hypothetical protein
MGHPARECPSRRIDREEGADDNKKQKYQHSYITCDKALSATSSDNTEWVLDGGSTRHYTGNKELLSDVRKLDSARTTITGNGVSKYNLVGNAEMEINGKVIQLRDVAYIPGFNANLISVPKIVDGGAEVTYAKTKAFIKHGNKVSFTVPRVDDLYVVTNKQKKKE